MSKLFELHIVTFGNRVYAHKIAEILEDKTRKDLNLNDKKVYCHVIFLSFKFANSKILEQIFHDLNKKTSSYVFGHGQLCYSKICS